VVDRARIEGGELGRQLDRRRGGDAEEGWLEGEACHLLARHLGEHRPPVADIDVPEPGETVEIRFVVGVPHGRALAARDDQRAVLAVAEQVGDRMEHVGDVLLHQGGGIPGGDHAVPPP